ncbi:MAG TPA: hypothetical protein VLA23_11315 [Candidatus Limnocylindrales bacterium]|nr:hypothetical protein [Candidatus Limnocylindrales bacterium]
MHEAAIARAIAASLRDRALLGRPVRVVVSGGHTNPADFDAALLEHLAGVGPPIDVALIEVVHRPDEMRCLACDRTFPDTLDACPACGGPGMPGRMDETIAIEPLEGPGS